MWKGYRMSSSCRHFYSRLPRKTKENTPKSRATSNWISLPQLNRSIFWATIGDLLAQLPASRVTIPLQRSDLQGRPPTPPVPPNKFTTAPHKTRKQRTARASSWHLWLLAATSTTRASTIIISQFQTSSTNSNRVCRSIPRTCSSKSTSKKSRIATKSIKMSIATDSLIK